MNVWDFAVRLKAAVRFAGKALDAPVKGLSEDSRTTHPGDLFFALPGSRVDGRLFLSQAVERGAVAAIVQEKGGVIPKFPQLRVRDVRSALAQCAHFFYGEPSKRLRVIGITGTKGKTTVTFLIRALLERTGRRCGLLGTVFYHDGRKMEPAPNTTPSALTIAGWLARMWKNKCRFAVMEVSSHGLALQRVEGTAFDTAVFMNLDQEHLDFHKSMEAYFRAKRKLFTDFPTLQKAFVNMDDAWGRRLKRELGKKAVGFAVKQPAEESAHILYAGVEGVRFLWRGKIWRAPLIGAFNVENILAALLVCREMGVSLNVLQKTLPHVQPPPGRMENVETIAPFSIIVDYAHTPRALERALEAARGLKPARLLCVFGCGGDRDPGKRPRMGAIAARLSDRVFVTSDNPRTESPMKILREISGGIPRKQRFKVVFLENRRRAIEAAVRAANPGDLVLIAGKGHETYQIVGTRKIPFDDREEARRAVWRLFGESRKAG